jgi:uncharacterized OsmC-like protein
MTTPTDAAAPSPTERRYAARAVSTDTFGRVLCSARNHHFVVDGPPHNGAPGEAITPAEVFLAAVAACGVELIQSFARQDGIPLGRMRVEVSGALDRSKPVRPDVTLFQWCAIDLELAGVSQEQAAHLVERFQKT